MNIEGRHCEYGIGILQMGITGWLRIKAWKGEYQVRTVSGHKVGTQLLCTKNVHDSKV